MHEVARSVLPGELVFGIGAHTGDKASWFADRGARVVAVEPQPAIAKALRLRFENNPNVVVVPKGLAESAGSGLLHINAAHPVLSTFSEEWKTGRFKNYKWDESVEIELTTLDHLVADYGVPRYAKVDVEGYEKNVMLGLTRRAGIISLEFTSEFLDRLTEVLWYTRGLGYKNFNYSLGERENFETKCWVDLDTLLKNLLATCERDQDTWGDVYIN